MFGGGATVTIVADVDHTKIYSIDKSALQDLFTTKPELAAKFYKFLATQICKRLLPTKQIRRLLVTASQDAESVTEAAKAKDQLKMSTSTPNLQALVDDKPPKLEPRFNSYPH